MQRARLSRSGLSSVLLAGSLLLGGTGCEPVAIPTPSELPPRQFFEARLLNGVPLGATLQEFQRVYTSATCMKYPPGKPPIGHPDKAECRSGGLPQEASELDLGAEGGVLQLHYTAQFFFGELGIISVLLLEQDYTKALGGLRALLGPATLEFRERLSGPLGLSSKYNQISVWRTPDYHVRLESMPILSGKTAQLSFYRPSFRNAMKVQIERDPTVPEGTRDPIRDSYEELNRSVDREY